MSPALGVNTLLLANFQTGKRWHRMLRIMMITLTLPTFCQGHGPRTIHLDAFLNGHVIRPTILRVGLDVLSSLGAAAIFRNARRRRRSREDSRTAAFAVASRTFPFEEGRDRLVFGLNAVAVTGLSIVDGNGASFGFLVVKVKKGRRVMTAGRPHGGRALEGAIMFHVGSRGRSRRWKFQFVIHGSGSARLFGRAFRVGNVVAQIGKARKRRGQGVHDGRVGLDFLGNDIGKGGEEHGYLGGTFFLVHVVDLVVVVA
mmetsp:Transcript_25516/g.54172  ORF Transcript_25516/g.54172 Transcript_25516/m.54172 type:complete len:257 (+) Transcript_25516:863-1633(+)